MVVERFILVAAALAALVGMAPNSASAAGGEKKPAPAADTGIEMSAVIAPVAQSGRLTNYVFMTVKLKPADPKSATAMQARTHIMRDAMVRAMHRTPINQKGAGQFDLGPVSAQLRAALTPAVVGGNIASLTILRAEPFRRS